ncbi:MAG: 4-hydroxy-3-methylbut-2-enyl diphosphate reductase [Rikenellaceae bacterium]
MGKDKLRKFAENLTFRCMIQPDFEEIFHKDYKLKGHWAKNFFGNDNPIVLELGCGKGEYAVNLAQKYPEKNFIGVDIKGARMWRGAKSATELGLPNVAFVRTRIEFIESFFGTGEVNEIWLTFSDPRLKGSQAHKRLTSPQFLTRYATFLSDEGVIHLKTDSAHLHHYTRHVAQTNNLEVEECLENIYTLEDNMPELLTIQTAYEKRFVAEGLPITYFRFRPGGKKEFITEEFWGDKAEKNLDEQRVANNEVTIDPKSGFCFGVVRAIEAAETLLEEKKQSYSLGEIVHNNMETARLEAKGLEIISHKDMESLAPNSTLLIRAHGEPPSTFLKAKELSLNLVDATCPVVASLQTKVVKAWEAMQKIGGQVLLLGKRGHSEVIGLTGQVNGDVKVIERLGDLDELDLTTPITLLSQTTQSIKLFHDVATKIRQNAPDLDQVTIIDTICRQVAGRNPHLKEFATKFEVIYFVSGRHSSNGKALWEVCRGANPKTYFVENEEEILPEQLDGIRTIGICGATSTPLWLMQKIAKKVKSIVCI